MNLDEHGRRAAQALRDRVNDDLPAADMLASVQRTRTRRRLAMIAPAAALVVAVAASLTATPGHLSAGPAVPGPTPATSTPAEAGHANGVLFGAGNQSLEHPPDLHVPPLGEGSSPTWSPDGAEVAVLAGGILITDTATGHTRRVACADCQEIAWSPDGRTFAAPGAGGNVLGIVDAGSGDVTPVPLDGVASVRSVTWAPASDRLAFLVTSPVSRQGAYSVGRDGSDLQEFATYPTSFANDATGRSVLLATRWSPTSDAIGVLSATPSDRGGGYTGPYALYVQTYHPDGSGQSLLVGDGHCACAGFVPNLAWSPDGTTLALFALHARPEERRLDVGGNTVLVRFLVGSGPLSWQPLPVGP